MAGDPLTVAGSTLGPEAASQGQEKDARRHIAQYARKMSLLQGEKAQRRRAERRTHGAGRGERGGGQGRQGQSKHEKNGGGKGSQRTNRGKREEEAIRQGMDRRSFEGEGEGQGRINARALT